MRKYPIELSNGDIYEASYIGVNHTAYGLFIGATISSYDREFDNRDLVCIESGIGDIRYCTIGDISEAYRILKTEIKAKNPRTLLDYSICVQNTVLRYFGDYSNIKKRLSFFPKQDNIKNDNEIGHVSDIAHKNVALGVERAMLVQNLLMEIGIKSTFKTSDTIINGETDSHAYNLINHDKKCYIFDATIPTITNGKISPLICEVPDEVYAKMIKPNCDIGISVKSSHYNPLHRMDYEIIYDAGREDIYDTNKSDIKKVLK